MKYTKNTFYALKVTFANQLYDICQGLGEDWYAIRDIITSPWAQPIGPSHLDPIFGLYRAFGGNVCLQPCSWRLGRILGPEVRHHGRDAARQRRLREVLTGKPSTWSPTTMITPRGVRATQGHGSAGKRSKSEGKLHRFGRCLPRRRANAPLVAVSVLEIECEQPSSGLPASLAKWRPRSRCSTPCACHDRARPCCSTCHGTTP